MGISFWTGPRSHWIRVTYLGYLHFAPQTVGPQLQGSISLPHIIWQSLFLFVAPRLAALAGPRAGIHISTMEVLPNKARKGTATQPPPDSYAPWAVALWPIQPNRTSFPKSKPVSYYIRDIDRSITRLHTLPRGSPLIRPPIYIRD